VVAVDTIQEVVLDTWAVGLDRVLVVPQFGTLEMVAELDLLDRSEVALDKLEEVFLDTLVLAVAVVLDKFEVKVVREMEQPCKDLEE
jgi:hypothetical protein